MCIYCLEEHCLRSTRTRPEVTPSYHSLFTDPTLRRNNTFHFGFGMHHVITHILPGLCDRPFELPIVVHYHQCQLQLQFHCNEEAPRARVSSVSKREVVAVRRRHVHLTTDLFLVSDIAKRHEGKGIRVVELVHMNRI